MPRQYRDAKRETQSQFCLRRRHGHGGFTLDVCAERWNAKCDDWFSESEDGLQSEWHGRVFCNCPYNNIKRWIDKAWIEFEQSYCELIVMLLPDRTDQPWFHQAKRLARIVHIIGRVQFDSPMGVKQSSNREGSILVIFEPALRAKQKGKK